MVQLLKICGKKDAALLSLADKCMLLNSAYIETRYPVHWPTDYSAEKARAMQDAAAEIGGMVKDVLEGKDAGS